MVQVFGLREHSVSFLCSSFCFLFSSSSPMRASIAWLGVDIFAFCPDVFLRSFFLVSFSLSVYAYLSHFARFPLSLLRFLSLSNSLRLLFLSVYCFCVVYFRQRQFIPSHPSNSGDHVNDLCGDSCHAVKYSCIMK